MSSIFYYHLVAVNISEKEIPKFWDLTAILLSIVIAIRSLLNERN